MSNREMQIAHGSFSMGSQQHDQLAQENMVFVHVFNIMVVVSVFVFPSGGSHLFEWVCPGRALAGLGLVTCYGGPGPGRAAL